jgi:hypothetical protein
VKEKAQEDEEKEPMHDKAFRPPNPSKKGYKGTINPFPVH